MIFSLLGISGKKSEGLSGGPDFETRKALGIAKGFLMSVTHSGPNRLDRQCPEANVPGMWEALGGLVWGGDKGVLLHIPVSPVGCLQLKKPFRCPFGFL